MDSDFLENICNLQIETSKQRETEKKFYQQIINDFGEQKDNQVYEENKLQIYDLKTEIDSLVDKKTEMEE